MLGFDNDETRGFKKGKTAESAVIFGPSDAASLQVVAERSARCCWVGNAVSNQTSWATLAWLHRSKGARETRWRTKAEWSLWALARYVALVDTPVLDNRLSSTTLTGNFHLERVRSSEHMPSHRRLRRAEKGGGAHPEKLFAPRPTANKYLFRFYEYL